MICTCFNQDLPLNSGMPEWLAVIILGVVEGITEFIPVSSTGHLLLIQQMFGRWVQPRSDLFNIVIQSGAVLAVIPLFRNRLKSVFVEWRQRETQVFIGQIALAFMITGMGGLLLEKNGFTLPDAPLPIALALLIGGILFLAIEGWLGNRKTSESITWRIAIAVGLSQLIAAVFPGASRSGTTILVALAMGLSRPMATEYSFLVGIPTMLAAGGYKIFKAIMEPVEGKPPEDWTMVALGFVVAGLVSFVAVKWLLRYVQSNTFHTFGYYRIAIGILILMVLFL
ncbi:MAG: undecaprenyl-diphosphate phosphatase [Verrucomicrobiota bacterium]|nr:undecaprenyl-diphosphate phosphatase [Verrucomicrobiota bacterium]